MLHNAIQDADILSSAQKRILNIICDSNYPVSAGSILDLMGTSKQAVHFSIKKLLERNFITREKDRVFVYKPNKERVIELIDRYNKKLSLK
tara:strand:- start:1094 stop:1366 length:273 start_codon:yes stop_codon:yes gene_type:complete